ncbi:MAG: GAF domain-containing protein [Caldilineaceae bacterium]|nr:GAF domain-containing protein [Caldilineaceae bacterium]MCB0126682.1 GAF domain-containing protein [Caldilineaceae bacterium]
MNVPALMATYQLRQREYLLRITRAMTSRLDLPSLLRLILNSAAELVGCRAGLIVLEDEFGFGQARTVTQYQIRAYYGIADKYLPAFEPLLDVAPLVQSDYDETLSQLDNHMLELQARVRQVENKLGLTLGQVVGLPLLFEDELLGMIYLFRTEYAFTQLDWQFLQGFADQAAVAVRNARLYHQLETERSRLATIVENSAHGILILSAERRVIVANQALAAMLDIEPESALGKLCSEVLPLQDVKGDDLCQSDNFTGFPTHESLHSEGDLLRPGGSRLTVSITYTPLYDEDDQLVNIVVNVHDITRFREEEEIKSTFTSIISHELKTPVALIKGYAQTLARPDASWDAETARQSLQVIEEEADRLEALINNLLDASRIQASGLRLDYGDVNLVRLAERVAEGYRLQTTAHEIAIDFPDDFPLVWGDEERLRQVLTNLVNNAIKYSPKGGTIRIGGWVEEAENAPVKKERRVVLYVADQGIGIPVQELPLIFDRFYRVDSSLRRGTAGAGLGLYLTKTIIEAHGGQIWARSEQNKGTTFFFALPINAPIEAPASQKSQVV